MSAIFDYLSSLWVQKGGGKCSECGAEGVTRLTCPKNPDAKNPKPEKHNAGRAPSRQPSPVRAPSPAPSPVKQPSPPRTTVGARAKKPSRGCTEQPDKKYRERPSPPYPANECCGEILIGNDGKEYESRPDKNGVCRWYRA